MADVAAKDSLSQFAMRLRLPMVFRSWLIAPTFNFAWVKRRFAT
jgi:hypothetical protein